LNKQQYTIKSTFAHNPAADLFAGFNEKTVDVSSRWPQSQLKPFNPDDLWQLFGDYQIYEKMAMKDDQVNIGLQMKRDLVLSSGWEIVTEDDSQQEIKEDLELALGEDTDVPFDDQLEEVYDCSSVYGFSLTEKLFKLRHDGSLTLKILKTRHPSTWLIHTDDHGNVTKYEQHGLSADLDINPKSLIHYIVNRRFGNPYGTSDLRAVYRAWFFKNEIMKYYAIFLEKYASPTPIARYDLGAPDSAIDDIQNAIKRFQTKTSLTIPKELEIEFLESKSTGDVYTKALNIVNMWIGRALFMPDLTGISGEKQSGGSQALGKEQMDLMFKHIKRRRESLERMVNLHIIKPLVFFNFGDVEFFPKFRFRPLRDQEALDFAKIWVDAAKSKVFRPTPEEINYFREMVRFPVQDIDELRDQVDNIPNGVNKSDKEVDNNTGHIEEQDDKKTFARVFNPTPGNFSKRVNFQKQESLMQTTSDNIVQKSDPVIDEIFEDLFDQIDKKKILKNQRFDKISDLKLKKKRTLKQILNMELRQTFREAKREAGSEINPTNFVSSTPLPSDAFLESLDSENFQFIGDWEFNINEETAIKLRAAIKDGTPLSSVLQDLQNTTKMSSKVAMERYARTKTTEVLNRGRLSAFDDSTVITGYQYSAILDGRTTIICAGLHGKKFNKGNQPVPPLHFNCRSLLIPLTKFDEFDEDTKIEKSITVKSGDEIKIPADQRDMGVFIRENKGKGFSTQ